MKLMVLLTNQKVCWEVGREWGGFDFKHNPDLNILLLN